MPRDLAFLDLETTGLSPRRHEILEVGIIRVAGTPGLPEIFRYTTKVLPTHIETADPIALEMNHYSPEAWEADHALPLEDAMDAVAANIRDATLAGHNIQFDKMFLLAANPNFTNLDYHVIDTVSLAYPLLVAGKIPNLQLYTVCKYLGIDTTGHHCALVDAELSLNAARKLLELYSPDMLDCAFNHLDKTIGKVLDILSHVKA